ncbi:hypothetical protein CAPTEDRAFT_23856, partial [Capitella teleta]
WEQLPSTVFVQILSYLPLTDRLNATSVCRTWRGCLFQPCLWRSIDFSVNILGRKRAKLLSKMCARFVREVHLNFSASFYADVKETLKILRELTTNPNLERLTLRPSSCQLGWPEREANHCKELIVNSLKEIIINSRRLKHLSLGCIGELTDASDDLLLLLLKHQSQHLTSLHINSVKEDPYSYRLLDLPELTFSGFHCLSTLGIDYDYVTNALFHSFIHSNKTSLDSIIIHVHGISADHEVISNDTWHQMVSANPNLGVTLNLIHSIDGSSDMLHLLKPAMPLMHLRQFFCEGINISAMRFISQHVVSRLRSIVIVDGMENEIALEEGREVFPPFPNMYMSHDMDEDPFVMLAWKAPNLERLTLIGYEIMQEDVVAIARLRGPHLKHLEI